MTSEAKELERIAKEFETDKNLDKFCQGIEKVAKRLGDAPMSTYMAVAHYMNSKVHGEEGYECEESKSGKAECGECRNFMHEADTCRENSIFTAIYRIMHPEHKPPHYEKSKREFIMLSK